MHKTLLISANAAYATTSSAIAVGPHDVLVIRNLATTNHAICIRFQSINDLEVYIPKVIAIGAIR